MTLQEAFDQVHYGNLTKAEKIQICEDLGLTPTAKANEIKQGILELMRDERSLKTEWTEDDARNFFRLCDYSNYNKLKTYLELENRNFIKFFANWYDNRHQISTKLLKKFSHSPADKYVISYHKNLNRFLEETSIDWITKQARINNCKNALIAQLGPFKKKFLEAGAKIAEDQWNGQKNSIWSKEDYIKREVDNRERYYNFAMISLAERLIRNGVDEENIKVNFIQEDYKLFEMRIEDGKSLYHARSIVAAEYSDIVTCHLRFIVTKF